MSCQTCRHHDSWHPDGPCSIVACFCEAFVAEAPEPLKDPDLTPAGESQNLPPDPKN